MHLWFKSFEVWTLGRYGLISKVKWSITSNHIQQFDTRLAKDDKDTHQINPPMTHSLIVPKLTLYDLAGTELDVLTSYFHKKHIANWVDPSWLDKYSATKLFISLFGFSMSHALMDNNQNSRVLTYLITALP